MPSPAASTTRRLEFVLGGDLYTPHAMHALVTPASLFQENLGSPLNSMKIIRLNRVELTPASNKMYGHALLSIVKPGCSPNFMDESEAKFSKVSST